MGNDPKQPKDAPAFTGKTDNASDDTHLDDGELSVEDLEAVAGGVGRRGIINGPTDSFIKGG